MNSCPGNATMQSTRSASIRFFRISPSLDCLEDIDPLASTNPASPAWRQMMNHVLYPGEIGVARRWHAVSPSLVFPKPFAAPFRDVEGWIGENKIGFQVRVAVVTEGVAVLDLPLYTSDSEIHLRESPGRVIGFLPVNGNVRLFGPLPFPLPL